MISILVTVYNRELFLEQTLKSVLRSTFDNYEVIVVDDNSTDRSLSIAHKVADEDKRIRVLKNKVNLGDYLNRNKIASYATGKYLKYLDADDLIYSYGLRVMVEAMEQHPDAALALSSNVVDPDRPYPIYYSSGELFKAHYLGCSPLGVGPSAAIIRRDCFEAVGGFSGKQFVGDTELWLKLAERWPIVSLPPALVWWRRHEGQQMQAELARPEILNVRYQLESQICKNTQHLSVVQKSLALKRLSHHHARRLWSLALRRRMPMQAISLAKESGLSFSEILHGLKKPKYIPGA